MKCYKCDNCGTTSKEIDKSSWITFGSTTGQDLFMKNGFNGARVYELSKHSDIHFCSKECLLKYLLL